MIGEIKTILTGEKKNALFTFRYTFKYHNLFNLFKIVI